MLQRILARARRQGRRLFRHSPSVTGAGRPVSAVLPEALESRVLMVSTVSISVGAAASEFSGTVSFVIERTSPYPPGPAEAFITLGGSAHESGPGDDYDITSGATWDAVAGKYKVSLGTPGTSVLVDPLTDSNYEEGIEPIVMTLYSVTGDHAISSTNSSTTGYILDSTTLQLTETVPLSGGGGDPNANGDDPGALGVSRGGVRLFDGTPILGTTDLKGFGGWGHTRSFEDALGSVGVAGNGWAAADRPFLAKKGTTLVSVDDAASQRWFDESGGSYVPRYFVKDTLVAGTGEYVLTSSDGNVTKYHDFSTSLPVHQRGTFKSRTDPGGNVTSVHSVSATGRATEVRRAASGGAVIESLLYAYTANDASATADLLQTVTLRHSTDGGISWNTVETVEYSYYDGTLTGAHAFGDSRDLRTATIKDAAGTTVSVKYYRYWTDNTAAGRYGSIKYIVEGDSYERLDAAVADPLLATDAQVALYADQYFEYDSSRKVTKQVERAAGSDGGGSGGLGTTTLAYATNPNNPSMGATDWNWWKNKTTETLPDGNQNIVYMNKFGEVMLDVFQEYGPAKTPVSITNSGTTATATITAHGYANGDSVVVAGATPAQYNGTFTIANVTANTFTYTMSSDPGASATGAITVKKVGNQWRTFYKYDTAGRIVLTAYPSAVTGFSEGNGDLLGANPMTGNYSFMADSTGLIATTDYGASTTATSSTPGDVLGYLKSRSIKQGETGTAVPQFTQNYIARTAGGATVYPVNSDTGYRNADGTGGQTTSYAYTFFTNTTGIESITTTLPTVTTAQNGPNAAATETVFFDVYGQPTWTKDADGFINAFEYDAATGATTKVIEDVNTTTSTNEPAGWTTPAGGGLHLVTAMLVDRQGRTTKLTDPNGNVTYTVYKDADQEVRVYPGWTGTATTGPTEVYRDDRQRKYTEQLTMSATPAVYSGAPTGSEAIASVESLSRVHYNDAGQLTASDRYVSLSGQTYSATTPTIGTAGTHYFRTEFAYDSRGRTKREKNAAGTITWVLYDGLNRPTTTWIGTDDAGATEGDPDGSGGANNMRKVSESEYDNGLAGDGNLTQLTAIPGGGAANRVTKLYYDWRTRLVAAKEGDQGGTGEGTDVNRQLYYLEYDNLSQTTAVEQYDADTLSITSTAGVPNKPSSSLRRARSETSFDELGQMYRTKVFSVVQSTGATGDALQSDVWYDKRGNVIKSKSATGLITKNTYDGAARVSKRFFSDGAGDPAPGAASNWDHADDVIGDKVLEQVAPTYDNNGNVTLVTSKQRFHDATDTGELGDPASSAGTAKARVSYFAGYYDAADRAVAEVDVGTNGGAVYTRPGTVPARSDTVLVDSYAYNTAGALSVATDPKGIEDRYTYDLAGQTTKTVEAYTDGIPSDSDDRTTLYTYDGLGNISTLTADLPTGQNDQTTQYVYGVTPTLNSDIYSNDLLAEVRYPDKTTGAASTANADKDRYAYNALGDTIKLTDRNQTTREFGYDVAGRWLTDAATVLGTGVDGAIKRLETAYDTAGRPYLFTTHSVASGSAVVNQVQRSFNGLGQVTREYQNHDGAVNTSTTPYVGYGYDTTALSGVLTKGSRPTTLTYPNGRVVTRNYASGVDDTIGRLSSLTDGATTLESYSFLGLGTVVVRSHPQSGVDLTYVTPGSTADAGDQYTGLDRFARIADQRWAKGATDLDRFLHTYDRNSNRLSRDVTATGAPTTLDEAYTYDNLDRVAKVNRGTLASGTITDAAATYARNWNLDPLGNWNSLGTDADGGGAGSPISEARTHNGQNQVTAVGASSLTFDSNGSLTSDATTGKTYTYDAWNALVKVTSAGSTIASHEYDALRRQAQSGTTTPTDERWFSLNWQVLETRPADGKTVQFVWSPVYVDAMVARDRDTDANGTLEERVYPLHDANFDVTALVDTSGTVIERFTYDRYGTFTVLDANWATDADGLSDVAWGNFYQGLPYDAAVQGSVARWRIVIHYLGRPLQADPIGYVDGMSRYEWVVSNPTGMLDPLGLQSSPAPYQEPGVRRNGTWGDSQAAMAERMTKDAERRAREDEAARGAASRNRTVYIDPRFVDAARREAERQRRMMENYTPPAWEGPVVLAADIVGFAAGGPGLAKMGWMALKAALAKLAAKKAAAAAAAREAAEAAARAGAGGADDLARAGAGGADDAGRLCFVAGTLVSTEGGLKAIEAVTVDENVWSYDLHLGRWTLGKVREPLSHAYDGPIISVVVSGERVDSTPNHPFWVVEGTDLSHRPAPEHVPAAESRWSGATPGRWVDAGNLRVGDVLVLRIGGTATIEKLSSRHGRELVYNLRVAELQTYAVGSAGVLVHNKPDFDPPVRDASGRIHSHGQSLPDHVPKSWSRQEMEDAAEELRQSLIVRGRNQTRLGEHGPHRARMEEEEQLLRQLEKKLEDLRRMGMGG